MELVAVTDEPRAAARDLPSLPLSISSRMFCRRPPRKVSGAQPMQALFLRELDQLFALRERHARGFSV